MSKTIFRKHYIQNADSKKKCRIWYSLDNRIDGRKCVTIYAKDCLEKMKGIIDYENDSDLMTDYFEKDSAVLFENHIQYKEARLMAEQMAYNGVTV